MTPPVSPQDDPRARQAQLRKKSVTRVLQAPPKESPWRWAGLLKNPWVNLTAVVIGILLGIYRKDVAALLAPLGELYLDLLKMAVLPIIITAIITSVAKLLHSGHADRYLGRLVLVFSAGVLMASALGFAGGAWVRPGDDLPPNSRKILSEKIEDEEGGDPPKQRQSEGVIGLLKKVITDNIFAALTQQRTLAIIFVSILLGVALGLSNARSTHSLIEVLHGVYDAFFRILDWALYGLPVGLCALLAAQVSELGPDFLLALSWYLLLIYAGCACLAAVYVLCFALVTGLSPLRVIAVLREPLAIAFVTTSSVAAIPICFERMEEELRLPGPVSQFVVPLGVVINRQGYGLLFALTTVFVAQLYQVELSAMDCVMVILISAIAGMAAVGAPTVVAPMTAYALGYLGLPAAAGVAAIVAISPVIDPLVSMTNLFGSCASAALIGKYDVQIPAASADAASADAASADTTPQDVAEGTEKSQGGAPSPTPA